LQTSSIAVGSARLRSGLIALAAIWVASSCATPELGAEEHAATSVSVSELSERYSLLYDLVSKEVLHSHRHVVGEELSLLAMLL
jgi:hypothetical protein